MKIIKFNRNNKIKNSINTGIISGITSGLISSIYGVFKPKILKKTFIGVGTGILIGSIIGYNSKQFQGLYLESIGSIFVFAPFGGLITNILIDINN